MKSCSIFLFISCLLLTSCSNREGSKENNDKKDEAEITVIDNYLPKEVRSLYSVSGYKDGKFYYTVSMEPFFEMEPVGVKYLITPFDGSESRYNIKQKDGDKYYLEKGKNYQILTYIVTHDEIRGVNALHTINLHRYNLYTVPHSFETSESINLREEERFTNYYCYVFTPTNTGSLSLKFKIFDFEFKPEIEVVDSKQKKDRYDISFTVDSSFLGSSIKSKAFKEGDTLKINTHYQPQPSDAFICDVDFLTDEIITINGYTVAIDTIASDGEILPANDVLVEYYHYGYAPKAISSTVYL